MIMVMEKLLEVLKNFKKKKILVLGDVFLDKFSWGRVERINPEQPAAPLVKIMKETYVLGGAANVANNISSLGASCILCGVAGKDFLAKKIKKICKDKGIKLKLFYYNQPTILKQRVVAHGQHISRLDFGERRLKKITKNIQDKILSSLKKDLEGVDFIIFSDYNKIFFERDLSRNIIHLAKSKNIPILVDPKPSNIEYFFGCSVIRPNEREAEQITGIKYDKEKETLRDIACCLAKKLGSKYVVITCGKEGVFCYDSNNDKYLMIETKAREVADVTGAGDTFAAALALSLASGLDIFRASKLANYAAGNVVGKVGTATTNIKELERRIRLDSKI